MFRDLIESQATTRRSWGGQAFSVVVHGVLIGAAVKGTLSVKQAPDKPKTTRIEFASIRPDDPPPADDPAKPAPVLAAPPPPEGYQILIAPIKIADAIPEIDLNASVTREADFSGKGAPGGTALGVVGGVAAPLNGDQPFAESQVEKPAASNPGNPPPPYPTPLRSANVEGQVLARFVVDTNGHADIRTLEIMKSDHELFTNAVRNVLPNYRFFPAELGGKKVKQVVQMPFVFMLSKLP